MMPGSELLRCLDRDARPSPVRWVTVGSRDDHIVPADRARIDDPALRAVNVTVSGVGHLELVFASRPLAVVASALGGLEAQLAAA